MRALLLVSLALVASASAFVEVGTGYHQEVGIPTAERIRLAEEKIIAEAATDDRVVGGAVAPSNAHPYFVSHLFFFKKLHYNRNCQNPHLSSLIIFSCLFKMRNELTQYTCVKHNIIRICM